MADEQIEEEEGGGKKGGLVKIIMLVVGVVLVVLLTIGLTLYFTGFFDPGAEEVAEEQISHYYNQSPWTIQFPWQ